MKVKDQRQVIIKKSSPPNLFLRLVFPNSPLQDAIVPHGALRIKDSKVSEKFCSKEKFLVWLSLELPMFI